MAGKITELTSGTPQDGDYLEFVRDPSGTPLSRRTTVGIAARAVNVPACSISRTSNQSVADNTNTPVQFDAADLYDTDTMHDPVTNNTRITFTTAGVYHLSTCLRFAGMVSGVAAIGWKVNNTTSYNGALIAASSVANSIADSIDIKAAAGDYAEILAYQTGVAGSVNLTEARASAHRVAIG